MKQDKTPENIRQMFDKISQNYDFINDAMSFGTQFAVKQKSMQLLDIKPHDKVLDLCTGTGDFAKIAKNIQPLIDIVGIDFSEKMLEIARKKNPNIPFFEGDATNLPYNDNYFDFVIMGFGLRNILNAEKAVEEIYRVLKPEGKFLHLDFGNKNFPSKIYDILTPILIKLLAHDNLPYKYLIQSKKEFPYPEELIKDFESKGFKFIKRKDYLLGVISAQVMEKPIK